MMRANRAQAAPALPGSYALHLTLPERLSALAVGRLGVFDFPAGEYIYLGSAHGPGGLHARLAHHARPAVNPHWHLDYLRQKACLAGAWFAPARLPLECAWSQALLDLPGAGLPAPGFGAADCRHGCPAHLVSFLHGLPLPLLEPLLQSFTEPVSWLPL
jgi:Uri superfamily endonuclease